MLQSWDYVSKGLKNLDNIDANGFYISKSFLDKLTLHIVKARALTSTTQRARMRGRG